MKRFLALLLAALCLLACLSGCVAGGADQAAETDSQLAPEQAATQAAESTQDKMSLSDIIRVPFGYLLEWLYQFANNYGVALILFSLIAPALLGVTGIFWAAPIADVLAMAATAVVMLKLWRELGRQASAVPDATANIAQNTAL